jgi:hypothetical protein
VKDKAVNVSDLCSAVASACTAAGIS